MQDKTPLNEKNQRHGCWEVYYQHNGTLYYKINYINGIAYGYFEYNYMNGTRIDKEYYAG